MHYISLSFINTAPPPLLPLQHLPKPKHVFPNRLLRRLIVARRVIRQHGNPRRGRRAQDDTFRARPIADLVDRHLVSREVRRIFDFGGELCDRVVLAGVGEGLESPAEGADECQI
jgi:hypothetical protein